MVTLVIFIMDDLFSSFRFIVFYFHIIYRKRAVPYHYQRHIRIHFTEKQPCSLISLTQGMKEKSGNLERKITFQRSPLPLNHSIRKIMPLRTYFMSLSLIYLTNNLLHSINEPCEIGFHGSDDYALQPMIDIFYIISVAIHAGSKKGVGIVKNAILS